MLRVIAIILTGIITSFYFFPFEFSFLPGINTKMLMASISIFVLAVRLAKESMGRINKDFFLLSLWGILVSLAGLIAVTYNNTNDYTYASYIMSMWVWLGGAYIVINCIRWVHGLVSVRLVAHYLIGVCVFQCIIALLIDSHEPIKNLVHTYVAGFDWVDFEQLEKGERLYGIGATLDVSGLRFSAVLVMISYLISKSDVRTNNVKMILYLMTFFVIIIVGNMMSRSTLVGLGLSLVYWIFLIMIGEEHKILFKWLLIVGSVVTVIVVCLYNFNISFRDNFRFAFEGFFSLWEKGMWQVNSNDILKNMYIFPDNLKTWLIGDGYFENPYYTDPNYLGPRTLGYYMNTDVGYLRFIFYSGLIGLGIFIIYFVKSTKICVRRFSKYKVLFLMLLAVNFICWFKVATDIFLVFALFLCIGQEENRKYEESLLENQ